MNIKERIAKLDTVVWTTKDNRKLTFEQMTVQHLINVKNMLLKKAESLEGYGLLAICYSGGEMAEHYAHEEGSVLLDKAFNFKYFASLVGEYLKLKYHIE